MSKAWSITTALVALVGIAPWAVFLGGLAKLTQVLTHFNLSQSLKQTVIMLEWYILSAQLFALLLVIVTVIAGGVRRSHSLLNMFLAVNTALLILQATQRIWQINRYRDGEDISTLLGVLNIDGDPLPYMRTLAAGEVSTAGWNFLMAIIIGMGGTLAPAGELATGGNKYAPPAAAAPMTA